MSWSKTTQDKAVHFLSNFNQYYSGVSKQNQSYYKENKSCGEDEEEFVLFLLQGIGLTFDEILNDVLRGVLEMSESEAHSIMNKLS